MVDAGEGRALLFVVLLFECLFVVGRGTERVAAVRGGGV